MMINDEFPKAMWAAHDAFLAKWWRVVVAAIALLLALATTAQATPITEWETEYVFLGQVGNSTDPSKPFNLSLIIRRELVYDIMDGVATLLSSREIRPEEYLQSQFYSQIFGTPLLPSDSPIFDTTEKYLQRFRQSQLDLSPGQSPPVEATPEPATLLLLGTSLGVAGWVARKRRGLRS